MKTKLLTTLFLSTFTLAHGDVLIYKGTERGSIIGGGSEQKISAQLYSVIDWTTGDLKSIGAMTLNGSKVFTVTTAVGVRFYGAVGTGGRTYTLITRYDEKQSPFQEILTFGYGLDSPLETRPGTFIYAPKMLKGAGHNVVVDSSDDNTTLTDTTSILSFLKKESQAANTGGATVDDVISSLRSQFLSKGYREVLETP